MGAYLILHAPLSDIGVVRAPDYVPGSVSGTLSLTSTPTTWARVDELSQAAVIGKICFGLEIP